MFIQCPAFMAVRKRSDGPRGFILLYDIDSRNSFEGLKSTLEKISEWIGEDMSSSCLPAADTTVKQTSPLYGHMAKVSVPNLSQPVYLIADSTWAEPGRQQVAAVEGRALADRFGCKFYESSSRSRSQVDTLVTGMIRECIAQGEESIPIPNQSAQGRHSTHGRSVKGGQRSIRSLTRSLTQRVTRIFC